MRWEYKVVSITTSTLTPSGVETGLNNQGASGWELISIINAGTKSVFVLKRLIVS